MRNSILTLFLIISTLQCAFAQTDSKPTNIDEFVSANIPGEVFIFDTIVNNIRLTQRHSNIGNSAFIIQKIKMDEKDFELNNLPYDEESLYKCYGQIVKGYLDRMKKIILRF